MISFELQALTAGIIFIASVLLARKNLAYAFYFLLLLVPLMHKGLFSFMVWDMLPTRIAALGILIFSGLFVLEYIFKFKNSPVTLGSEIIRYLKYDPFGILLSILWLIRGFSLFRSEIPEDSIALFAFYSLMLGLYFVFRHLLTKHGEKFYSTTIRLYLAAGVFTGLFAVLQYYLRLCCRQTIGGVWIIPGFTPRLGSTFWDVNHYGGYLITLIPILFTLIFISKRYKYKVLSIGLTIFFLWLLFMTQSRSAWLGLAGGMSLSLLIYYWNALKRPLIIAITGALIGLAGLLTYTTYNQISIRERIANYMHFRLDSTDTHFMLLEGAGEIFLENFYLGAGYGGFDPAFRETNISRDYFAREPRIEDSKVPPHSVWGEVLGETGAIGITLYGLFVALLIGSLITSIFKAKNSELKYLGTGILGSIVSIFIAGLFYSYNLEFFWITLFLGLGYIFIIFNDKYPIHEVIKWWARKPFIPYLVLAPFAVFYIFLKLGSTTLIDWDEAIYAKVARNIVESGDWLSLRWERMSEYWFEKPPLYMWLSALIFQITNFTSFGARFISALFGVAGILMTYRLGAAMFNRLTGLFAGLILLSTVTYVYYARNGMLDVTVTFFIISTITFYYMALKSKSYGNLLAVIAGIMLGLGVMTKAVIGLLPVPILVLYILYLWIFEKEKPRISQITLFTVASLAVALPWHIYSYITHGAAFWNKYFISHIWERGSAGLGHEESTFWYLEVIKVSFRIWIVPFLLGLVFLPFIEKRRKELVLLLISVGFIFTFFTVSKDKLLWYIIPIYPFMAVYAARFMEQFLVVANSMIKKEFKLDPYLFRGGALFLVFIVSIFYIVIMRDRIYYPDFNRSQVSLIKIHNETFPRDEGHEKTLYYTEMAPPVILFYSDHKIEHVDRDRILKIISNSRVDESNMFLVPQKVYYDTQSSQDKINVPLGLDIRGSAGSWVLFKSKSQIEIYNEELAVVRKRLHELQGRKLAGTITVKETEELEDIRLRYTDLVNMLTEYGYPPY